MDISNWQVVASLASTGSLVIALWVGWTNRKWTNRLIATDRRKQASQFRVTFDVREERPGVVTSGTLVPMVADITVENASDDVMTDVWIEATIHGSTPDGLVELVGYRYLLAKRPHTYSCRFDMTVGQATTTVLLSSTFTDAMDVRWRLDRRYKLSEVKAGVGFPKQDEARQLLAGNEDDPLVITLDPDHPAG
jgi:hypothetical protein